MSEAPMFCSPEGCGRVDYSSPDGDVKTLPCAR